MAMQLEKQFINEAIENDEYQYCNRSKAEKCVKIAENFAIGFAEWFDKLSDEYCSDYTVRELLEIYKKNIMKEQNEFLNARIEALEAENKRLNDQLRKVKDCAFKVRLSDSNFDKPLSEIETNFEIVTPN